MQSLLVVDKIKESDSNANPYIADAVIIALDAKEEILIVNTEDALHDIQNLKLINNYYDTLMETYADNKESNNLRSFHSKFKTVE